MATLAQEGRITLEVVDQEIARLRASWSLETSTERNVLEALLDAGRISQLDLFDLMQLESVIRVCRQCATLSDAGRKLFAQSRSVRATPNDADRLRKYLTRFGLDWASVTRVTDPT